MFDVTKFSLAVFFCVLVSACGGGSQDSDDSALFSGDNPPDPAPAPAPEPGNSAPEPADDVGQTSEDSALSGINVLANDVDIDGDNLTVTAAQAQNGAVTINGNFTLNYTPDANFNGTDTVTYTVSDGEDTASAVLSLSVTPVNDPPVARDDQAEVQQFSSSNAIDVLSNDDDIDDTNLDIASAEATFGDVTIENDTLLYTPTDGFAGTDMVSYAVADGDGETSEAMLTVEVVVIDAIPVEITWDRPMERANGEQLLEEDIQRFEVRYKRIAEREYQTMDVDGGDSVSATILVSQVGEYEFQVATVDINGLYSEFTEPVFAEVIAPQ